MDKLIPAEYSDLNTITVLENGQLITYDIHSGKIVSENKQEDTIVYSIPVASMVCDQIRNGKSLLEIAALPNMPNYNSISRWKHLHPDFAEAIKRAKKDRAELYHDKVLSLADGVESEEDAKINKIKIDAYKWAAEKNSPEEYGKKEAKEGNAGVTFIINSGIPAAQTIEVQYNGKSSTIDQSTGSTSEGESAEEED